MHKHFTEYNGPFQAGVEIYLVQRAGHLEIQQRVISKVEILRGRVFLQFEAPHDYDQLSLGDKGVPGHAYDYRPQEIYLSYQHAVNALTNIAAYWISQELLPEGTNTCKTPVGEITFDLPGIFATEKVAETKEDPASIQAKAIKEMETYCTSVSHALNKQKASDIMADAMNKVGLSNLFNKYLEVTKQ